MTILCGSRCDCDRSCPGGGCAGAFAPVFSGAIGFAFRCHPGRAKRGGLSLLPLSATFIPNDVSDLHLTSTFVSRC
jgi:hypothetical protein